MKGLSTKFEFGDLDSAKPIILTSRQLYVSVLAVACLPLGLLWDISWHISIGRDTFWAPAHIVIQLGGFVPALLFAWQAARITFRGAAEERAAAVPFFG